MATLAVSAPEGWKVSGCLASMRLARVSPNLIHRGGHGDVELTSGHIQ